MHAMTWACTLNNAVTRAKQKTHQAVTQNISQIKRTMPYSIWVYVWMCWLCKCFFSVFAIWVHSICSVDSTALPCSSWNYYNPGIISIITALLAQNTNKQELLRDVHGVTFVDCWKHKDTCYVSLSTICLWAGGSGATVVGVSQKQPQLADRSWPCASIWSHSNCPAWAPSCCSILIKSGWHDSRCFKSPLAII